jgi:hypothetical protein
MYLAGFKFQTTSSTALEVLYLPDSTYYDEGLALRIMKPIDSLDCKQNRVWQFGFYGLYNEYDSIEIVYPDTTINKNILTNVEWSNTNADTLDLSGYEAIDDINMSNNDSLKSFTIDAACVIQRYYGANSSYGYIDWIQGVPDMTDTHDGYYSWSACSLTAAEVNQYLYDLDQISSSGYNNRKIYLNGTGNAAPDATSGGYDGTAAKNSLVTKGFTVYTN